MIKKQIPFVNIQILSSHKGCFIMSKLLNQNRFKCSFVKSSKQIKNYERGYIIADDNQTIGNLKQNYQCQIIVLKDTQKSPASIFALSGQLSTFGQNQKQEFAPLFVLDFVIGISLSILICQLQHIVKEKQKKMLQVSIIDLVQYYGAFNISAKQNGLLKNPLGKNLLDGGAPFYSLYKCKQGVLAVGNLQPKFYSQMIKGMKLNNQTEDFLLKNQLNFQKWDEIRQMLNKIFITKSAFEWEQIMSKYDTCVTEVINESKLKLFSLQPKISTLKNSKL